MDVMIAFRFSQRVDGRVLAVIIVAATSLACLADARSLRAAESLHVAIDRLIASGTADYEKIAAPLASDAEFLRRVYLDVIGKPPTAGEAREFLADESSAKRTELIDRLLDRPEYARHMQHVFDVILMRRLRGNNVKAKKWQEFLRTSFAENKSWDAITREILSADGSDSEARGQARFYLDRGGEIDTITRDVGRIFLGADLECAQCHDHPMVADYTQADYYGISAFLVRSFIFNDKKSKQTIFAEKAEGEVSFESVFDVRDETSDGPKSIPPQIFGDFEIEEPEFEKEEAYEVKPADGVRPIPKFSRRAALPEAITSPENRRFARTSANRFWSVLMGRGIVEPVEMDHSDNPPSHPELLGVLAGEFVEHGYDIKWFLREVLLSKTYQRSSRRDPSQGEPADLPGDATFAQALLKPLSPAQFAWAVLQATGESDVQRAALGDKYTEAALHKKLAGVENNFVGLFGGVPGKPPEEFESTVAQVLFLSNDNTILNLIKPKQGNLAGRLLEFPADELTAIADELFLSVLCRRAEEQEIQEVQAYLAGRDGEGRKLAVQELIWSLIASAEFRFNH